ncbi:MAG: acylneuraminate cytidylyltransferase family protein [Desulfohalobiaceae bacterium]|nr:acylneuraminate cytidylyltransferase family protein [Desulfohalobiaceae bacterium]
MKNQRQLTVPAIILARGGSKGVPGKNIRPLAGKPLLLHTIEQAGAARTTDPVYVSTDDEQIASTAASAGALVIHRPPDLAADDSSSESALLHALKSWRTEGLDPDIIAFLQCTSPIRKPEDIDQAVTQLLRNRVDSLLSVAPTHRFLWTRQDNGAPRPINFDYEFRQRRQDLPPQYVENGSIYIFRPWVLENSNNRLGGKLDLYVMPEESSLEIDSELDFDIVEYVMRTRGYVR